MIRSLRARGWLLGLAAALAVAPSGTAEAQQAAPAGREGHRKPEVVSGGRTVAAGERLPGGLVVLDGPLDVSGVVDGNAVVLDGDLTVRDGGVVRGNAVALGGRITLAGGRIEGRQLSLDPPAGAATAAGRVAIPRGRLFAVLGGVAVLLAVLAIATTMIAQPVLDGVASELAHDVGKALLVGAVAQLGLVPGLVLTVVGLALTIVGVFLVPFAVVAYVLAAVGLVTLGLLAVARLLGGAAWGTGAARHSASRASLGAVLTGLTFLLVPWAVAFAMGAAWPSVEWLFRLGAAGVTWVGVTAGMGAALLSRVGLRPSAVPAATEDAYAWATPTPVTGVAAARRPVTT